MHLNAQRIVTWTSVYSTYSLPQPILLRSQGPATPGLPLHLEPGYEQRGSYHDFLVAPPTAIILRFHHILPPPPARTATTHCNR